MARKKTKKYSNIDLLTASPLQRELKTNIGIIEAITEKRENWDNNTRQYFEERVAIAEKKQKDAIMN